MKKRIYIFFFMLTAVFTIAQSGRSLSTGKTNCLPFEVVRDSVIVPQRSAQRDSLKKSTLTEDQKALAELDSVKRAFDREHGISNDSIVPRKSDTQQGNSKAIQWNDSIAAVEDSIAESKKGALEDPVAFESKDSLVFYMDTKNAHLYGDGKVDYQNITLTSDLITMNMDSSVVHAVGVVDSLGNIEGKPVFKQGSDEYELDAISYNFKSQKAFITNVSTEQQEGFLRSYEAKKVNDKVFNMRKGTYTTCDEEHPHFYIALSRGKVYRGKSVFSGPAWLVVEDVPLPLAVPFAYFPFTDSYSSGFIMPSYGDESTRGFYLRDGGYYFAINDNWDLKLTGEIFTKGSWGIGAQTTYKKRYKYSGNFYFNYQVSVTGEKNIPGYSKEKNFKVQWSHKQDAKANPNSSFSASVNFATQSFEKNNLTSLYNPTAYSQSIRTSSIRYSRNIPSIGLSITSSMNISQNMRDSVISLTLPNLSISLQRIYPFRRKKMVGKERWYEKINLYYTGLIENSIRTKENKLLKSNLIKDWTNGMKHTIPVSASFQVLKYINVVPSFTYNSRWYTRRVEQSWDQLNQHVVRDTIYGFNNVYDYNLSVQANTKLYGFYKFNPKVWGQKLQMVRHVFTPSVSFNYAPDFSATRYGYHKTYVQTDINGNVTQKVDYSPFEGSLYSYPGKGKVGSVSLDIGNNIEMKVKSDRDSTGVKKISLIDELGASITYNMAAKTQPWGNLNTRLRLKWGKFTFNMNTTWQTYAYAFDERGNVIVGDRTEWSYGRWGRYQGTSKHLSYTFNNQSLKKIKKSIRKLFGHDDEEELEEQKKDENSEESEGKPDVGRRNKSKKKQEESVGTDADGYMKFSIPWTLTISYGISMSEDRSKPINVKSMRYPYKFVQNLNISGSVRLSSGWNIAYMSGYDFTNKAISMTTVNISRDMHCFNISGGMTFGPFTSYHVTMRANASTLTDALKYDKKSSYSSSIRWY